MKRSDEEIINIIEQEERVAYGINDSELSNQRAQSIRYYLGEPFGNEIEGRSQVVSYDVQDTIESALPQLIKIFASGDRVVQFNPRGPDDEAAAEQESDYINYVVMERNRGFEVFYNWFKDALLSKNGYVKIYPEKETETEEEQYEGLTDGQLQMLAKDKKIEILEHESYPDPDQPILTQNPAQAIQMQPNQVAQQQMAMLHNVKIKVTDEKTSICIKNVAPEAIMVSVDTPGLCLQESRFVQHRELKSPAELEEEGFKVPDNAGYTETDSMQQESVSRDLYSEQFDRISDVSDLLLVKDTYLYVDGERKRFVVVGNTIVHREECEYVPIVCISPMLMPHRHIGRSYADLSMDIQLTKSALIRGQLDNMYLSNNGRYAISDRVNLEDMLTSRPGGVVRVQGEPAAAILPLQHTPFPASSFKMVEYLDSMKEKRTGVTAYNQGLDSDSLNKTATGINLITQAAAARLELVARVFAETGVKELFMLVHKAVRQSATKPDVYRLRGKWVDVDPRVWKNRADMSVTVGLGTGNKDAQLMHIQTILAAQQQFGAMGLVSPQNAYKALTKLTQNAGFRNPEEFWTDPGNNPPPQQQPDPKIGMEQAKLQAQQQSEQMKLQAEQQKFQAETQLEEMKFKAEAELERQKAQWNLQQEQLRSENDMQIERDKLKMQGELEQFKAQLKAETDLKIAMIQAEMQAKQFEQDSALKMQDHMVQMQMHNDKLEAMMKAKKVVRDEQGRVTGIE